KTQGLRNALSAQTLAGNQSSVVADRSPAGRTADGAGRRALRRAKALSGRTCDGQPDDESGPEKRFHEHLSVWDYGRRKYVRLQIEAGVRQFTDSAKLGIVKRPGRCGPF